MNKFRNGACQVVFSGYHWSQIPICVVDAINKLDFESTLKNNN